MKKSEATNTFDLGLLMDLNPLVTPNNVVTNCLNGTLVTYNGNEHVLLNDMGNGRVETAYLPEGYVPLGTAELGGIIYIVSYNPLRGTCQIGSFPSPERNITSDELPDATNLTIDCSLFYKKEGDINFVISPNQKLILTPSSVLRPGDKFLIYTSNINSLNYNKISALDQDESNPSLWPKYLKFNIVAVTDDGKMTNLNDTLTWQPISGNKEYYIRNDKVPSSTDTDIDEYRNLVESNYHVFQSKTSGKLGIVAELECIDSFDIAWDALKTKDGEHWNIYLYTNWTYENDYAPDKINLGGVYYSGTISNGDSETPVNPKILDIGDYPYREEGSSDVITGTTDIVAHKTGDTFLNPPYISNIEEYLGNKATKLTDKSLTIRNNDGSDNLFLISTPITVEAPASDKDVDDSILHLSVMPSMPFGVLEWMELTLNINLSKLGSGEIDLVLYRYYVEDEIVQLNWGLEAYPEHNKSVKNVTFDFYPIDTTLLSEIEDSSKYFDTSKEVDGNWDGTSTKVSFTLPKSPSKTITNVGQSSYSGYFTEVFNREDLVENNVYLVRISIDYNGEKTIRYYRIFYNSPMFNSYFYNGDYEDYSKIVLNTTIDNLLKYNIDSKAKGTETLDFISDKPPVVTEDPGELDSYDTGTGFNKYKLIDIYTGTSECILTAEINDVFKAEVSGITLNDTTDDSVSLINDALADKISNSSISSSITLDKIETKTKTYNLSVKGNTINDKFNYELEIPLQLKYNSETRLNVSYTLEHISATARWLIYRGRDKYHMLGVYPDIEKIGTGNSYETRDSWGDDTQIRNNFAGYSSCYSDIANLLNSYDVVFLPVAACRGLTADGNKKGSPSAAIGFGSWNNLTSSNGNESYSGLKNNYCGMFYAMKTVDGDVVMFAVTPSSYTLNGENGKTISVSDMKKCMKAQIWKVQEDIKAFNDDTNKIPAFMCPFKGYYIPKEFSGNATRKTWSQIQYYPPFTASMNYSLSGKATIDLSFNSNVKLNSEIGVKNLYYENPKDYEAKYSNFWDIDTLSKIEYLNQMGSQTYVALPNGDFAEISVGKNKVYSSSASPISKMANWNGDKDVKDLSTASLLKKGLTFTVSDEHLRIKATLSSDVGEIDGGCEEQNIVIRAIPILS